MTHVPISTRIDRAPRIMNDLLALSHVPRWAICSHSKPQSVGDHSFRVAVIYMELLLRMGRQSNTEGLIWALVHDGPEAWTGDIPGPYKSHAVESEVSPWWHDFVRRLSPDVKAVVKLADLIEGATYITKWGVGPHAAYAAQKVKREALEKAREIAPPLGFGPDRLYEIADSVISDIECETGRCG